MKRIVCTVLLLTVLAVGGCCGGMGHRSRGAAGWAACLDAMNITGTLEVLPEPRDWRWGQVSSADPSGGSEDGASGAYRVADGLVLADLEGPGAVLRIWARNPSGTLSLYVDDMNAPLLKVPFADLFSGRLDLFSAPLVGEEGGGCFCYVPISYRERCCMVLRPGDPDVFYQVSYADFPAGTPVESFDNRLTDAMQPFVRRWRAAWGEIPEVRFVNRACEEYHKTSRMIWQDEDVLLWEIVGPATIVELEMSLASPDPAILQKAWLAIYWDGQTEPCVLAPVGALFGSAA